MTISPFQHELDGMGNEGIGKTNNLTRMLMYLGDPISKLFFIWHSCREKYESIIFQMLHKVFRGGCSVERECVCGKMREEMHASGSDGQR